MLNRRHLRVKVLQSLYAFFQSGSEDLATGEKELFFGIDKILDLYLYQFSLLSELHYQAGRQIEENKQKKLPSRGDLYPNTRFVENSCLRLIARHPGLQELYKRRGTQWSTEAELVRRLLHHIQQQHYYREYMAESDGGFAADRDFVLRMIKKDIMHFEMLHQFYEDRSIYWLDDWELVNKMIIKTLLPVNDDDVSALEPMPLFRDEEDRVYARELFRLTAMSPGSYDEMISARTANWDIERIALMDIIIMKMALTEILRIPGIPVKVSLNEYIELSKMYSTPKSKLFVNGVLDKLVIELREAGQISPLKLSQINTPNS